MKAYIVLTLLLLPFTVLAVEVQKLTDYFSKLHSLQQFSGSVIYQKNNKTVYSKSFGKFSLERDFEPSSTHYLYSVGSISKIITATAILKLHEQKHFSLKDKISSLLPNLGLPIDITVIELLSHSSGLIKDFSHPNKSQAELLKNLTDLPRLENKKYSYSNVAYDILGLLIEKISGETYLGFINSKLFIPQNLAPIYSNHTKVISPNRPNSLSQKCDELEKHPYYREYMEGSGSIVAYPESIIGFFKALKEGKIIQQELYTKMITPYATDEYGLGIVNLKRNGITILGHNGSIPGFGSVAFNNNKGESIFVFSNLKQFPVATVSLDTIQLLAALNIEMPKKINRTEYSKVIPNLTDYVGLYTLKSDSNYRFNVLYNSSDNYLYYKDGNEISKLFPETPKRFFTCHRSNNTFEFLIFDNKPEISIEWEGRSYSAILAK